MEYTMILGAGLTTLEKMVVEEASVEARTEYQEVVKSCKHLWRGFSVSSVKMSLLGSKRQKKEK